MKTVILTRRYESDRTVGELESRDHELWAMTLERPWLDNQVGISCIPEGEYEVHRDKYGRHTWFAVQNVEGRTHIEMHEGSKPWHSQGCILINTVGLQDLLLYTKGLPFKLIIRKG